MTERVFNLLFLCTGNSARSILAESILNQMGKGSFRAFSAGSHPTGQVNPFAVEALKKNRFPVSDLRSKSWDEFAKPEAPMLDFVFTVCDKAAGQPMTAHWGIEDPASVEGDDNVKRHAMLKAFHLLSRRISIFLSLPIAKLDAITLQHQLNDIGNLSRNEASA